MRRAAIVGVLLVGTTACGGPRPAGQPSPVSARPAGADRVVAGVPVGYRQTPSGAQQAAVAYVVALGGPIGLDPGRRDPALAAISPDGQPAAAVAQRWASRPNVERATGVLAALRTGTPLIAATTPVLAAVSAYSPDRATVTVWVNAVLGTELLGALEQSWSTETVTLDWHGDWKLEAYDSAPGPVPGLHQPVTPVTQALARTTGMAAVTDVG